MKYVERDIFYDNNFEWISRHTGVFATFSIQVNIPMSFRATIDHTQKSVATAPDPCPPALLFHYNTYSYLVRHWMMLSCMFYNTVSDTLPFIVIPVSTIQISSFFGYLFRYSLAKIIFFILFYIKPPFPPRPFYPFLNFPFINAIACSDSLPKS